MLSSGWHFVCHGVAIPREGIEAGVGSLLFCSIPRGRRASSRLAASSSNTSMICRSQDKGKDSGRSQGFAGLSLLKDQLEKQKSGGFASLSAVKEQIDERRVRPAPLLLQQGKADTSEEKRFTAEEKGSISLVVSNLAKEVTRAEYESLMEQIPQISSCTYLSHKTGQCRGYGFCELRPGADVAAVIELIHSQALHGKHLEASVATGKRAANAEQEEAQPTATPPNQQKAKPRAPLVDTKRKQALKKLKDSLKWSANGAETKDGRNQLSTISAPVRNDPLRNVNDTWKRSDSGAQTAQQVSTGSDGRLTGQKVLDALERFASTGREKQRRPRGPTARSSSEPEEQVESLDEQQLIEIRPDWALRIQSLESNIELLKRS